jgi:hypothetical protein
LWLGGHPVIPEKGELMGFKKLFVGYIGDFMIFRIQGLAHQYDTQDSRLMLGRFNRITRSLSALTYRAVYVASTCLILLALVFIGPGVAEAQWPLGKDLTGQESKAESGVNVTATGRFQIFVSPQAKGSTFMIDTDTGRVWVLKKDHTSGEFSFHRIQVEQVDPQAAKTEKTEKTDKPNAPEGNK